MTRTSRDRFARAQKRRRLRRWSVVLGGAAILGLIVFAGWIVWFSSWLAVDNVNVSGQSSLKTTTVKEKADVPDGVPLARIDTTAIEARVSSIARIEKVAVTRGWPHTVRINVTERTPVAWMEVDKQVRAIDRNGVDYRRLSKPPKGLTEMRIPTGEDRQAAIDACAEVLQSLSSHDASLLKRISVIKAETPDSIELTIGKGRSIRWGSPGEVQEKLRVLSTLLDTVNAGYYDVSAPARPTTRK